MCLHNYPSRHGPSKSVVRWWGHSASNLLPNKYPNVKDSVEILDSRRATDGKVLRHPSQRGMRSARDCSVQ